MRIARDVPYLREPATRLALELDRLDDVGDEPVELPHPPLQPALTGRRRHDSERRRAGHAPPRTTTSSRPRSGCAGLSSSTPTSSAANAITARTVPGGSTSRRASRTSTASTCGSAATAATAAETYTAVPSCSRE